MARVLCKDPGYEPYGPETALFGEVKCLDPGSVSPPPMDPSCDHDTARGMVDGSDVALTCEVRNKLAGEVHVCTVNCPNRVGPKKIRCRTFGRKGKQAGTWHTPKSKTIQC